MVGFIQIGIIARSWRLTGRKVTFCCGEDTHGTPISLRAEKDGISPENLIAQYYEEHAKDLQAYHISLDSFFSTNTPENQRLADHFFSTLKSKNLIYTKEVALTYCDHDKRFLPDRFVKGSCPQCKAEEQYGDICENCGHKHEPTELVKPYCVLCKNTPTTKKTTHYFFRLSSFADDLADWLENNPSLQKEMVNQHMYWLQSGLKDWDVSRDPPYFGFRIPGELDQYYYVWLDAPIGYLSSLANFHNRDTAKALAEWNKSEILQTIGKDIVYFHYLFWPAMLTGVGLKKPDTMWTHGFLTVNGEKMSKSRGTFFTAKEFASMSSPELLRFYYARNLSKKVEDINLDVKDFVSKINNELVANIANFVYRTLSFCDRFFGGEVTLLHDKMHFSSIEKKAEDTIKLFLAHDLREATKIILGISQEGNRYFQDHKPWELVKTDKETAQKVITQCVSLVKVLTILLKPILPVFASKIERQLNKKNLSFRAISSLENHQIGKAEIVLRKIESLGISTRDVPASHDIFSRLNLKVGVVMDVKDHPEADKLYVLQVDIGKKIQLVAGVKEFYAKDDLKNKHIVVLSNLKPARLRGVVSQGMLLAAESDGEVRVVEAPKADAGAQVFVESIVPATKQITIDEFNTIKLTTKNKKVIYKNKSLCTERGDVIVDCDDNARIR
jgi:methionyl-tRNA synthetase